jgi:hypothetical protein
LVLMEQPARIDAGSFARSAGRGPACGGHPGGGDDAQPDRPRPLHRGHDRDPPGPLSHRRTRGRPARSTETCACLTLQVTSPRWDGVPFTVCSGKAPAADSAEIAIHCRRLPRYLPGQWPGAEPNVLRLGLADSAFTSADHWHRPSTGEKNDPSAPPAKE